MAGKVERPGSASALAASFIVRWPTGAKLLLILSIALLPLAIIAVFATLQTTRNADTEARADLRLASTESSRAMAIELIG
ncbi:MAG: histidine kinase, partial [Proteobacteria bacterium]|nr:histidine kinase [Pseudomonadota bacterium]